MTLILLLYIRKRITVFKIMKAILKWVFKNRDREKIGIWFLILWNDFKRFSSQIKLSLVLRRCSFQISFQPFLPVGPVTIIRFQIQTWIVPGRCITQIIFWEMVFPNILFVFSFYLRNRYILLPMMSPEELRLLRKYYQYYLNIIWEIIQMTTKFKGQNW